MRALAQMARELGSRRTLQKPLATGFYPMAARFYPTPRVSGSFILAEGYNLPLFLLDYKDSAKLQDGFFSVCMAWTLHSNNFTVKSFPFPQLTFIFKFKISPPKKLYMYHSGDEGAEMKWWVYLVKQRRLENSPARGDSKRIGGGLLWKQRRAWGKSKAQWLPVLFFVCLESPRIYDEIRTW